MTEQTKDTFEQWCIVEIFGHERIAGKVTEQRIGGSSFVRVDVPDINGQQGFTRLYGEKAIYSITPVSEDIARRAAAKMQVQPVSVYQLAAPSLTPDEEADAHRDGPDFDPDDDEDDDDTGREEDDFGDDDD